MGQTVLCAGLGRTWAEGTASARACGGNELKQGGRAYGEEPGDPVPFPFSLCAHTVPGAVVCLPRVAGPMPGRGCCRHRCSQLPFWVPGLDFPRLVSGAGPKQQYHLEQVSSESGLAREGRKEEKPEPCGRGLDTGQLLRHLLTLVRSRNKPGAGSTGSEREASQGGSEPTIS